MGWDVVEIGLKHDLPVEDPRATADVLSKRMNRNIRLVACEEFKYDSQTNTLYPGSYNYYELAKFKVNESDMYLNLHVCNYQIKTLHASLKKDKTQCLKYSDIDTKRRFNSFTEFELYEFDNDDNGDNINIRIFRENVDLDVYVTSRYSGWQQDLHNCQTSKEIFDRIEKYRLEIYKRAQMCGCKNVIICSDQGPTMSIYDMMDVPTQTILDYTQNKKYIEDYNKEESNFSNDTWDKRTSVHLYFPTFMQGEQKLSEEDFVTVIFDDFSDLRTAKQ